MNANPQNINIDNPLLDFSDLPRFDLIHHAHVGPAIESLLQTARAMVSKLENNQHATTWENFVRPLEEVTEKLSRAWGIVSHLNAVADTPELRNAYNENQPKVTEFWTALSQNLALYHQYKAIKESPYYAQLSQARRAVIDHALRDFQLGGAELAAPQKERFANIQEELAALSTKFSENVLDATNAYSLVITDESALLGLPDDAKQAAQQAAQQAGKEGYLFTLHFPSYFPVLQYADNRSLREQLYRAYATKASEMAGHPQWDNSENMVKILALRAEEAQLLGYASYTALSLVPKMAHSPEQVLTFLEDLAQRARPFAEQDYAELRTFAQQECGLDKLEAWDMAYVSEKLRQKNFAFSDHEVKEYFPEPKVIDGLFYLAQQLFDVQIKPDVAPTWHPDVKFFRIEQTTAQGNVLVGQFYLDTYARPGKRSGAWMDDARGRKLMDGHIQTPIAYLTCNFSPPLASSETEKPVALLTHDEVLTLFHEFGHGLHHMLTGVDELSVAGISGVEWDAVELPSQFMENFCWDWQLLQQMTAYAPKGAKHNQPLPESLYKKMLAAKNFQAGLQTLRQIEFSLFDLHLHYDSTPNKPSDIQQLLERIRQQIAVVMPPAFNRFAHSFSHIFAGGYAAGYYSYKWAEVLSADAFGAFEESVQRSGQLSVLDAATGARFKNEILAMGSTRSALESFKAFRGREPTIDALLRHNGMLPA